MDFFEHQEVARRTSRRLIVLFALAVLCVVVAVNVVGAGVYFTAFLPAGLPWGAAALPNGFFLTNTLVVLGLIAGGTALEMSALASGGEAVARMVGARPVDPSTRDLLDRRLLNVVEEMAIASGVAVPRVFVMDDENSINAFAAGHSINDAVIAVTRGTLTRLTRDELQGVIGHEFSHVLNGDMRLNMRLIGVLFGLTMVAMAGRFLLEVAGRGRGGSDRGGGIAVVALAGVTLWVLGYIGVFFGRLIKAAVSRQREFLADASAVQFTRNPDGIGGALRKIGGLGAAEGLGTRIDHPRAESLSHLFLGAARPAFVSGLFATHPPITERVRRIYGRAREFLPAPEDRVALALDGRAATEEERAADSVRRSVDCDRRWPSPHPRRFPMRCRRWPASSRHPPRQRRRSPTPWARSACRAHATSRSTTRRARRWLRCAPRPRTARARSCWRWRCWSISTSNCARSSAR